MPSSGFLGLPHTHCQRHTHAHMHRDKYKNKKCKSMKVGGWPESHSVVRGASAARGPEFGS